MQAVNCVRPKVVYITTKKSDKVVDKMQLAS